ncbi:hypothetical protein PRIPAC_92579 [Pristionchus pacificus]|uniref:Uncharacterized protein n=1 Tax=Pristionchus pacificus TaxID=54126 RepID=A0A2A6BA95_PRIPA|nr:hypothetical protein PRIPAC_92579 [Pristionchus pacificus]|eukprot:PDM62809.1 hypothetical protein PRIPAC_50024 [Pristionchus pacificus]
MQCPPNATFNASIGRCRCNDGFFKVKGEAACMPRSARKVLNATSTAPPKLPSKEMDNLVVIEYVWICFSIALVVALIVAAIYCFFKSRKGFSRLSEKRQEEKI